VSQDSVMSVLRTILSHRRDPRRHSGRGAPRLAVERALAFAACAGRYAAEVEHAWLLRPGDSDDPESRRDAFVALLDAVAPDAIHDGVPPQLLMATRIEEKAAQAMLLTARPSILIRLRLDGRATPRPDASRLCGDWLLGA
jgi:hypothetical protein